MPLSEYRHKRSFKDSPEPKGQDAPAHSADDSRFVIHKHRARTLHYDLRLELDGVLKCWAIPKGPSLDPREKRLAIHVEDHPLDYLTFEGLIPPGQYGAGPMLVWDAGRWNPVNDARSGYDQGELKFTLAGHKLQGQWVLVRTKREQGKHWLLIKERDQFARSHNEFDILAALPNSVFTGRSLDQIEESPDERLHDSNDLFSVDTVAEDRGIEQFVAQLSGARSTPELPPLKPALPTLVKTPPDGEDWLHEIKYDGYRMLCLLAKNDVQFVSRNGLNWTNKLPTLSQAVGELSHRTIILDGEVAIQNEDGTTNLQSLQNQIGTGDDQLVRYFVFDILYYGSFDVRDVPLIQRKEILHRLLSTQRSSDRLVFSDHIIGNGPTVYSHACQLGAEGIVSKRLASRYSAGRTKNWLKTKRIYSDEFVVLGFIPASDSTHRVGSLVLGQFDEHGNLQYVGRVGTGFSVATATRLAETLSALRVDKPTLKLPARIGLVQWTLPAVVVEIEFADRTKGGLLRHAVFRGVRDDLTVADLRERQSQTQTTRQSTDSPVLASDKNLTTELDRLQDVHLTHPDRILFPKIGITKLDLAEYYANVAHLLLPHVADRPLSLVRCPKGVTGNCFFQKHPFSGLPQSIRRFLDDSSGSNQELMVIADIVGLMSLVQFGVIEIHTWSARCDRLDRPDLLVIDLDPDEALPWPTVVSAAIELRNRLSEVGLMPFVKTTGGKGLHVVVAIKRRTTWQSAKQFAQAVAKSMIGDSPKVYTDNSSRAARRGKIYIDIQRNTRGATFVAPYSVRARGNAPISAPVTWEELPTIPSSQFLTIRSAGSLIGSDAPWSELSNSARVLTKQMQQKVSG